MIIVEAGVGKITCLLIYLEEIDIEEKIRYLLFVKNKNMIYKKNYMVKNSGL